MGRQRASFPWPRLTMRELMGMVLVVAAYNGYLLWLIGQARLVRSEENEPRIQTMFLGFNAVVLSPMALVVLVRWSRDVVRYVRGRGASAATMQRVPAPPARIGYLALTEIILFSVVAATILLVAVADLVEAISGGIRRSRLGLVVALPCIMIVCKLIEVGYRRAILTFHRTDKRPPP